MTKALAGFGAGGPAAAAAGSKKTTPAPAPSSTEPGNFCNKNVEKGSSGFPWDRFLPINSSNVLPLRVTYWDKRNVSERSSNLVGGSEWREFLGSQPPTQIWSSILFCSHLTPHLHQHRGTSTTRRFSIISDSVHNTTYITFRIILISKVLVTSVISKQVETIRFRLIYNLTWDFYMGLKTCKLKTCFNCRFWESIWEMTLTLLTLSHLFILQFSISFLNLFSLTFSISVVCCFTLQDQHEMEIAWIIPVTYSSIEILKLINFWSASLIQFFYF